MKMKKIGILMMAMALSMSAYAKTEKLMVEGAKGKLSTVIQVPELKAGEKVPMVMLMHGFMGNKNGALEQQMADGLEAQGIASIRFDFNGHGESEGDFQEMTVPNEIEDAKKIYAYAKSLPYVEKVAMSGHSQGGVVTAMTAGELGTEQVACVVLLAPAAVLRDDAIRGNTMGKMYDPLSPPEYVEMFGGLKLGREYIKTAFWLPIYETAAQYAGPACIIHGTGDRVVPFTYGERFHQLWKGSVYHRMDGHDHGFSQDLRKVTDLAVRFLVEHLK